MVRTYLHTRNGKKIHTLLAWTQDKCIVCGKFLCKYATKYCPLHYKETRKNYNKNWERKVSPNRRNLLRLRK
jgi:hypothetical protein